MPLRIKKSKKMPNPLNYFLSVTPPFCPSDTVTLSHSPNWLVSHPLPPKNRGRGTLPRV